MVFSITFAMVLQTSKNDRYFLHRHFYNRCLPQKKNLQEQSFDGLAEISKSTYGWFFGFKLHLVINEIGEIQALTLTKGNVDDRKPVPTITKRLTGLLFGDKGYIKKELFEKLFDRGLKLVTKVKKGIKNVLISF